MHDGRFTEQRRDFELGGENPALHVTRRIVVVVVQAALAHSNGSDAEMFANDLGIALRVELVGPVRVHSNRVADESLVQPRYGLRRPSVLGRIAYAHDMDRACVAGAADYFIAIRGKRVVR
jgi:hypothetical protein